MDAIVGEADDGGAARQRQVSESGNVAQLFGYLATQPIPSEIQSFEIGKVAQPRGYAARQFIAVEMQMLEFGKIAQPRGYAAIKAFIHQFQ